MAEIRLSDFLTNTPCQMRNFQKAECPPAYWCNECGAMSRTGACERDKLKGALKESPNE